MLSYLFLTPTCLSNSLKDLKWPEINYDVIIQDLQGVGNIIQETYWKLLTSFQPLFYARFFHLSVKQIKVTAVISGETDLDFQSQVIEIISLLNRSISYWMTKSDI